MLASYETLFKFIFLAFHAKVSRPLESNRDAATRLLPCGEVLLSLSLSIPISSLASYPWTLFNACTTSRNLSTSSVLHPKNLHSPKCQPSHRRLRQVLKPAAHKMAFHDECEHGLFSFALFEHFFILAQDVNQDLQISTVCLVQLSIQSGDDRGAAAWDLPRLSGARSIYHPALQYMSCNGDRCVGRCRGASALRATLVLDRQF